MKLNSRSVEQVIDEVNTYRNEVVRIASELGQALVEEGIQIAKLKISILDAIETGAMLNDVNGLFDTTTGKGFIKVDAGHAAYVEFGTGVVGQMTKSLAIDKPSGWGHDLNQHGWQGWVYDHGRWTRGMSPRPFMWYTWYELCEKAEEMVRLRYG